MKKISIIITCLTFSILTSTSIASVQFNPGSVSCLRLGTEIIKPSTAIRVYTNKCDFAIEVAYFPAMELIASNKNGNGFIIIPRKPQKALARFSLKPNEAFKHEKSQYRHSNGTRQCRAPLFPKDNINDQLKPLFLCVKRPELDESTF